MAIENRKSKDGTVSYRAVYYEGRCKVAAKTFARKFDARKWLEEMEARSRSGIKGELSFTEAVEIWLNHAQGKLDENTLAVRVQRLRKVIVPFFGNVPLADVTPERIDRFMLELRKRDRIRKNTTINDYLKSLSAVFGFFVKRRYIMANPALVVDRLKEDVFTVNYMSFEEKVRFLAYANQKYLGKERWVYVLYLTLLSTGLRWSECAALQWDAIDWEQGLLTIRRTYCKATYKVRERVKSGRARYVGINSELFPELKSLLQRRGAQSLLIFPSQNGSVLIPENFKRDHFNRDLKACGLRHFRIHDMRHTFASHFVMLGGNVYKLQTLLGHGSMRMTERYAHLAPNSVARETEILVSGTPWAPHGDADNKKGAQIIHLSA